MKSAKLVAVLLLLILSVSLRGQKAPNLSKGKLFLIGGGERSPALMKALLATASLRSRDYVIVLPMASESPDTAYAYFKSDLVLFCSNPILNFNFTIEKNEDAGWLDSIIHARLIFITGGDQSRFMKAVLGTPVYSAIHKAYDNGATIAGTSAGAAVMTRHMITGNELTDTSYRPTFNKLHANNIEITQGLGLIDQIIVDQHFITRSRYNRLLSALAAYPHYTCVGIDEGTAIVVDGNVIRVTGAGQVVVISKPEEMKAIRDGLIKVKDLHFSVYTQGDQFWIGRAK